jgi:hypothetical protein
LALSGRIVAFVCLGTAFHFSSVSFGERQPFTAVLPQPCFSAAGHVPSGEQLTFVSEYISRSWSSFIQLELGCMLGCYFIYWCLWANRNCMYLWCTIVKVGSGTLLHNMVTILCYHVLYTWKLLTVNSRCSHQK